MKWLILIVLAFPIYASHYEVKLYKQHHSFGLKRDAEKLKRFKIGKRKFQLERGQVIPGAVDLSAKVSPPENQGNCGACWDFSITKAARSALMLVGADPGQLSFNYLLNNCGPGTHEDGCNGGDFPAGDNFLNGAGDWSSAQDPYTASEGSCKTGLPVVATALSWNVVGSNDVPTFQELAAAIAQNHMLSIDVAVCGDWENYSSGIFDKNQCGANGINHMINQVGYNCQTSVDATGNCVFSAKGQPVNGDGYLLVMNNWGNSWGENGYMRTRYGVDAVANTAMFFDVTSPAPSPVPPVPPAPPAPEHKLLPWWARLLMGASGIGVLLLILL
jgi:Papain family cysteine protease